METDPLIRYEELKRDYFDAEKTSQREKASLLEVANTLGRVVSMHPSLEKRFNSLKKLFNQEGILPTDQIEEEVGEFRKAVFEEEKREDFAGSGARINSLEEQLQEACRVAKRIMIPILEDFYPIAGDLKSKADAVQVQCPENIEQMDLEAPLKNFSIYIKGLKKKISEDFRNSNNTFLTLLDQLKELEKVMTSDFEGMKTDAFKQFETKVNSEVGSIVDSFTHHSTIQDIKGAVIEKIVNIKKLMSKRKDVETARSQRAQKNIEKLKKRIKSAEHDAEKMSKKAKQFQKAATIDGLTGLYNRKAFDTRLLEAQTSLNQGGEPFSLVIFDVDKFKWINDTFGHVAGDKVLKKVGQSLKETFRKSDFIARYGGDEFAVVIEALSVEMAHERITKFEENFRKKRFFSQKNGDIKVGISAGVSPAEAGETPEDLINRADQAMYALKESRKTS